MEYKEAYRAALRFLNVRFLSEEELRRKLRCREVTDEIIDEVTEKLKSERFLDDHRLAEGVYRYYAQKAQYGHAYICLLYTSPSPRDISGSRMPSSAWKKKKKILQ